MRRFTGDLGVLEPLQPERNNQPAMGNGPSHVLDRGTQRRHDFLFAQGRQVVDQRADTAIEQIGQILQRQQTSLLESLLAHATHSFLTECRHRPPFSDLDVFCAGVKCQGHEPLLRLSQRHVRRHRRIDYHHLNLPRLEGLRGFQQRGVYLVNLLDDRFSLKGRAVQSGNHLVHELSIEGLCLQSVPVRKISVVDHLPLPSDCASRARGERRGDCNLPVALRAPSRLQSPDPRLFHFFLPENAILHNHRGGKRVDIME